MLKRAKKRPFTGNRTNVISREPNPQEELGNDMESSLKKNPNYSEGGELVFENNHQNIQPGVNIRNTIKESIGEIKLPEYPIEADTAPNNAVSNNIIDVSSDKAVPAKFPVQFILFMTIIMIALSVMRMEYKKYVIERDRTELKRIQKINADFSVMERYN